jgi:hypothetical protein
MPKAAKISILHMIKRHAEMYLEMERLCGITGDAPETKEYRALVDESMDLEWIIPTSTAHTSVEYAAQIKFVNRADISDADLDQIMWYFGRSARALGIRRPPRLRRRPELASKARARYFAAVQAEYRALAAA